MMRPPDKRKGPGVVAATARAETENIITTDEDNGQIGSFQRLDLVTARIIRRVAERHRLTEPHARVVVELAGLGGAQ